MVAFLWLDGMQRLMPPNDAKKFQRTMNKLKKVINVLMDPVLDDSVRGKVEFLEVNHFYVSTAINW